MLHTKFYTDKIVPVLLTELHRGLHKLLKIREVRDWATKEFCYFTDTFFEENQDGSTGKGEV